MNGTGSIDHVVVIVEENKPASSILGSSSAPYLNKLADESALAANYAGITHPSLPNYLALTGGTTAGITEDCSPKDSSCTANVKSIAEALTQSGRSWKMYAEGMPAPCKSDNSGRYAVRHNPFMYYPGVTGDTGSCAAHVVPFTELEEDLKSASSLPNYVFISPDLCNDMHDCSVKRGDDWLSREVPKILGSPAFTTQKSLLVVTWDEGDDSSNQSVTIFAGPAARTAVKSDTTYNHYSLLHTIENALGLSPLTENDKNAPIMSDLLK
ncbi:phospholipase C [Arthrobacter sp. UYEF20]